MLLSPALSFLYALSSIQCHYLFPVPVTMQSLGSVRKEKARKMVNTLKDSLTHLVQPWTIIVWNVSSRSISSHSHMQDFTSICRSIVFFPDKFHRHTHLISQYKPIVQLPLWLLQRLLVYWRGRINSKSAWTTEREFHQGFLVML